MKRFGLFLGGATLALTSSLALAGGPEDLLPPAFRDPPPQATPTPAPAPTATSAPARPNTPNAPAVSSPGSVSAPVVQDIPGNPGGPRAPVTLPEDFPTLEELEEMESFEVNDLFGLRPRFDIPAAARRDLAQIGVLAVAEGGFPAASLARQPEELVRAALSAADGPVVSRWGHILLRRALASRMDAPDGMSPVEFAALRASALNAMGEHAVARSLVQDIDGGNYNLALTNAAYDAYLGTGDILGACPVARLRADIREDGEWQLLQAICASYLGEARSADRSLDRALGTGVAPEIDVRLAQRYAGAAGDGGRAVNIEWDDTEDLTPWRFSLARSLGVDLPDTLSRGGILATQGYAISDALIPATPLMQRVRSADVAGARGVLSSSAMVDLYAQLWASDAYDQADKEDAALLREAYVATSVEQRVAAMRQLWNAGEGGYGRSILTAYAAARLPVSEALIDDAGPLIASMLAAGLDRNAMLWGSLVPAGSEAWALLALAQPQRNGSVSSGDVDSFIDDDASDGQRKSAFLVAGLAGLGRLDDGDFRDFAGRLGVNYDRRSAWSSKIEAAAGFGNPGLVALLAGVGMQGVNWEQMTPRHLFHIVRALDQVGLSAEARMIAAEAVARG